MKGSKGALMVFLKKEGSCNAGAFKMVLFQADLNAEFLPDDPRALACEEAVQDDA